MLVGYLFAILIGLSLGLLGGGGSILTVPILVYVLNMDPKISIALSLAIVGVTSLFGVFGHYKNKNVDLRVASVFAPVAMGGTFLGAKLSQFLSGQVQLLMFAIIMIIASFFMLKGKKESDEDESNNKKKLNFILIGLEGLFVGIVTGLVGVGGGFLIVPALVLLGGVTMKKAVGTSLLIISLKSFAGFAGYIGIVEIPWLFLGKFTLFSVVGIFVGSYLVKFVSQSALKKAFAIFLIIMGFFILYKNKDTFITSNSNLTHSIRTLS
ncbi:permease [Halobacteriovorax marinus]|uniref:sulfite exporter TauE/SafE family protein n=1 Tax=Halobacteriovorax marinus TaxID=97084 RepID=UPI000BC35D6D|nr:sulfite exporter TauE/SafE family protein [Halobacteriovorax marinus]ATH06817.1 permease [Halobacteriovorax marinus]